MGNNQYSAGIAIPPGETLQEILDERLMSQKELASRLGCSTKHVNKLIKGTASITADFAIKLEIVLNVPASFWLSLEANYQETLARLNNIPELEEEKIILKKLNYRELSKREWVPETRVITEQIQNLRKFFSVSSLDLVPLIHEVAFRKSEIYNSEEYAIAAWINKAEEKAKEIDTKLFNIKKLEESLKEIKKLTLRPLKASFSELKSICSEFGVTVVLLEHISNTHINGMTKWLPNNRALIALSIKGGYEDIFWFTFFHEIGHVVQKKKDITFIDMDKNELDSLEKEADMFALNTLLSQNDYSKFIESKDYNDTAKLRIFCREHSVHPGILVGRLMKDKYIDYANGEFHSLRVKIPK